MKNDQPPKPDDTPDWGQYMGIGLQMMGGVVLGVGVGWWLDRKFGWMPWATIIGAMLGLASGMYLLIKEAILMNGRK